MKNTKKIGDRGERVAREYLQKKGYKFLNANYRNRYGELDLVMKDKDVVVFVEVKTKSGDSFGKPEEMVSRWKLNQIKRMGVSWIQEYGWERSVRVDVVGVVMDYGGSVESVRHWDNVS